MTSPKLWSTLCLFALVASTVSATAQPPAAVPACPTADPPARGAAHGAVALMTALGPELAKDVLSPSRYQLASSGRGIEFNPAVVAATADAKAALAFAQMDDSVAEYLRRGEAVCESDSQGFYLQLSSLALAVAASPGRLWCGASLVSGSAAVSSQDDNPFVSLAGPSSDKFPSKASRRECSPFFGPDQKNAFLIVALSKIAKGDKVVYTLAMDPAPYSEPGQSFCASCQNGCPCYPGNQCGMSWNPWGVDPSQILATPTHQNEWAQRIVNGVCLMGSFSKSVVMYGMPAYKWVQVGDQNTNPCPFPAGPPPCASM